MPSSFFFFVNFRFSFFWLRCFLKISPIFQNPIVELNEECIIGDKLGFGFVGWRVFWKKEKESQPINKFENGEIEENEEAADDYYNV